MAYSSINGNVYVACNNDDTLAIVNTSSQFVSGSIGLGSTPGNVNWVVFDSANGNLYVTNGASNNVTVISAASEKTLKSIGVGSSLSGETFDPANGDLYVSETNSATVAIVSTGTNSLIGSVSVGTGPDGMSVDSTNGYIYVANQLSGSVSVISGFSNRVVATVPVGTAPVWTAYDPASGDVYVTDYGGSAVSVISGSTNSVISTIPVGSHPIFPCYDSLTNQVYVSNWGSNNVSVISGASNSVVRTTPVGNGPGGIAFDSDSGALYVANSAGSNLTVIQGGGATPPLVSVMISPLSQNVSSGGFVSYASTIVCRGGPCPAGANYSWSLTNSLAGLRGNGFSAEGVVGGSSAGDDYLFVNASLNGKTVEGGPATVAVLSPSGPTLSSVGVSPDPAVVSFGGSQRFNATTICTGGGCPSGAFFGWSLNNGRFGRLLSNTGPSVVFSANSSGGEVFLFVNATLNGITKQSAPVLITVSSSSVPTLASVAIVPGSVTVGPGSTQTFTAAAVCNPSPCPTTGLTYSWSLSNSLGTLSAGSGASTSVIAGSSPGAETLTVNSSLNGVSKTASATIVISAPSSAPPTFLGLSPTEGFLVLVAIIAAVVGVTVGVVLARRRSRHRSSSASEDEHVVPTSR